MFGTRLGTSVSLAIVMAARFAAPGNTQTPAPSVSAPPSPSPAFSCPPPMSTPVWVQINVLPDGNSCRFDPQDITLLKTRLGDGVDWTFCSTCSVDTKVELEVRNDIGPFKKNFRYFFPTPQSDNLVTVKLPSNAERPAFGREAREKGGWKYHLTLKPAAGGLPLNEIDPRLEIDDSRLFPNWLGWILLILLGVLFGGFGTYMMRRKAAP